MSASLRLVWPSAEYLPGYVAALHRGWQPDLLRGASGTAEDLCKIHEDSHSFLASLVDREARGAPIALPDGSSTPRLPGYRRWLWDDEFCGTIGLRWQHGTEALPATCMGHIGYTVVPWKRRLGYATCALGLLLPEAKAVGLRHVEITTDPDSRASRRVIEANGGLLIEHFTKPDSLGATACLRFRIVLC
ncbi:MAG: GNAT family N-acetyltransferase [Tahibacter sp.]